MTYFYEESRMKNALQYSFGYAMAMCSLVNISCMHAMEEKLTTSDPQKKYVDIQKIESMCETVYQKIKADNFKPELLIGLARGGLIPLGFLAGDRMLNNRNVRIMNVQSYNDNGQQSDIHLSFPIHLEEFAQYNSILVMDDLADSGGTLNFVLNLLKDCCSNIQIKTAVLFYKQRSTFKPDYFAEEATNEWIVFPWEGKALQ